MTADARWVSPLLVLLLVSAAFGEDWPTWRHDAARSGATGEQLAEKLHLQWRRELPPLQPAWPEDPRLHFDAAYAPVVVGRQLFVGSSNDDSVTAFSLDTGERNWSFQASGPVRFSPVVEDQRVYFGSDDGSFYCLNARDGAPIWKRQVAPNARKAIGNDRLISVWPMRGGPLLLKDKLLFTVGVWPFEGAFLMALDKSTGAPVAPLPGGRPGPTVLGEKTTPQGFLAATPSKLFIPCGRNVVAAFDRQTGEPIRYSYRTHSVTDYHVNVSNRWLFHGVVMYDTQTKATLAAVGSRPIATEETLYASSKQTLAAFDLRNPQTVTSKDRRGRSVKKLQVKPLWKHALDLKALGVQKKAPVRLLVKAGSRLYGHCGNRLFALDLPSDNQPARITWTATIAGDPASMLAANGKLLVVTKQGGLLCFGRESRETAPVFKPAARPQLAFDAQAAARARRILEQAKVRSGFCLVVGLKDGKLAAELARQSQLRVIGIDSNAKTVQTVRQTLTAAGRYGHSVAVLHGTLSSLRLPPYMASLVVTETTGAQAAAQLNAELFRTLRPYGGLALLPLSDQQHQAAAKQLQSAGWTGAELTRPGGFSALRRAGKLAGSADWTHEYGDPANSLMSRDQLVKAPLGVLWFGGPAASGDLFYNRHYWGPSAAVIEGRMFLQGPDKLTAVDVYTGRILWKIPVKGNQNYNAGRRGNDFEGHLAGYHMLAVKDGVYLVNQRDCIRFDPATGRELSRFQPPQKQGKWGRIRVRGDLLIASVFVKREGLGTLPAFLVALDRRSGAVRWMREANLSFPHVAIGKDRLFVFDGAIDNLYRDWKRKGLIPKAADIRLLKALDLKTGKPLWERSTDMVVTWLGFSEEHNVLVTSNRAGMRAWSGDKGGELWKRESVGRGFRGHPENLWDRIILWQDRIIDQRGPGLSYDLRTGKSNQRLHPITNEQVNWEFTKTGHHCNYAIANPHLMTFRADSAGFCDIESGNTARLEGYRSGCRNSLIPANGVLNSPNMAHGCVCGYSLFTSLALIHVPANEVWSYSALPTPKKSVQRLGINLGAPGDRKAADGTLWLEYPRAGVSGPSPDAGVKIRGDKPRYFRRHTAFLDPLATDSGRYAWVAASGVEGAVELQIDLRRGDSASPARYKVRLHFAEPNGATQPGARVFDVLVENKVAVRGLDVVKQEPQQRRVIKEVEAQVADSTLSIRLQAQKGRPVLSGIEVVTVP